MKLELQGEIIIDGVGKNRYSIFQNGEFFIIEGTDGYQDDRHTNLLKAIAKVQSVIREDKKNLKYTH